MGSWGHGAGSEQWKDHSGSALLPPHKHVSNCGQDPLQGRTDVFPLGIPLKEVPTCCGGPREHSEEKPGSITEEPLVGHRCPLESWEADAVGTAEGLLGESSLG